MEPTSLRLRTRRPPVRAAQLEPLECRIALSAIAGGELFELDNHDESVSTPEQSASVEYPGGVTVTATHILTKTERIPRFVAQPTITSVRSGPWDHPGTWSSQRVPGDGDRVAIAERTNVYYTHQSDARIDAIEINGGLIFSRSEDTRLIVADLTVMPTGSLLIGSTSAPIAPNVTTELIFADKPINTEIDPEQFGTGLIALGTVIIHGAPIDPTWTRLAIEPKAGDVSLLLNSDAADWQPGDSIVLPDTRQVLSTQQDVFRRNLIAPQWEEVVIQRVAGRRVFLEAPLEFDHLGARNTSGELELLPHAAVLNRNVIIRSENPAGTRGHLLLTARADTNIAFARFEHLGRTSALRALDNTTFDAEGNVTHVGTNQIARYAVHYHHLMGPENPENVGYQFQFVGNSVEHSRKWAVVVHGTSFGLVSRNVVYDAEGGGIVTEDGSEIGNLFHNNIVIRVQGTHFDGKWGVAEGDYGRGGSGFWFRRGGNLVVGNVTANNTYAGFVIDGYFSNTVMLPLFRGAERDQPGQGVRSQLSPGTVFLRNETYGLTPVGLWAVFTSGSNRADNQPVTRFRDLRIWNVFHTGVVAYHTANVTFDDLLVLGDETALDRNNSGTRGMDLKTYENRDLVIRNSRIEGVRQGILAPVNDSWEAGIERPTLIENTVLKNYINIVVSPPRDDRPSHGNLLLLRNVRFALRTELPDGPVGPDKLSPPANIHMRFADDAANLTHRSIVRVYRYNGVAGDNFQVFYREQAASWVMPRTDPALVFERAGGTIGSPESGLTNAENWVRHGLAMGGAVAPAEAAASRPEINGLVAPVQGTPTPRVVFATPWAGSLVQGNYVRMRINVAGRLPDGARVYYRLDDQQPALLNDLVDGGLFGLSRGQHTLRAFVGTQEGRLWPGTSVESVSFFVTG